MPSGGLGLPWVGGSARVGSLTTILRQPSNVFAQQNWLRSTMPPRHRSEGDWVISVGDDTRMTPGGPTVTRPHRGCSSLVRKPRPPFFLSQAPGIRLHPKYSPRRAQWTGVAMTEKPSFGSFRDDGSAINPDPIAKPSLRVSCRKGQDPNEEIPCTLTRADQQGEDTLECFAFEPKR
jgi:hypothetical protein